MSLICVQCGKIIVMSTNPDHFGNCASCRVQTLTEEDKKKIIDKSWKRGEKK